MTCGIFGPGDPKMKPNGPLRFKNCHQKLPQKFIGETNNFQDATCITRFWSVENRQPGDVRTSKLGFTLLLDIQNPPVIPNLRIGVWNP